MLLYNYVTAVHSTIQSLGVKVFAIERTGRIIRGNTSIHIMLVFSGKQLSVLMFQLDALVVFRAKVLALNALRTNEDNLSI